MNDLMDQICLGLRNVGRAIANAFDYCLDCCIDGFYVVADALGYILSIPVAIFDYICIRAERAERDNAKLKDKDDDDKSQYAEHKECDSGTCKCCSGERCGLDVFKPRHD